MYTKLISSLKEFYVKKKRMKESKEKNVVGLLISFFACLIFVHQSQINFDYSSSLSLSSELNFLRLHLKQ